MHHWPFGAVIALVTGLVVAFVLIFASMRSIKKTDAWRRQPQGQLPR